MQSHAARRISEIVNLKAENIDFEKCEIRFEVNKGKGTQKKLISVYFSENYMIRLSAYLDGKNSGFVFTEPTNKNHIKTSCVYDFYLKAWKSIGFVPREVTHCLRSQKLSAYFSSDVPIDKILSVSGHSHVSTLFLYNLNKELTIFTKDHSLPIS
jgi:integrase